MHSQNYGTPNYSGMGCVGDEPKFGVHGFKNESISIKNIFINTNS